MGIKLVALCQRQGLTQAALAEDLQVSAAAVGKWWRGEARPYAPVARALAERLGVNDPNELWLEDLKSNNPLEQEQAMDFLKSLDRRELFALLQGIPALAGIDFSLIESHGTPPDEFLSQANAAINGCWHLMKGDGMSSVDGILAQFLPRLANLANASEFQEEAAPLAVQVKIMGVILSTRKGDFIGRKLLCRQAVQFAELSGDSEALTAALNWQGDTYVYCCQQPKKARAIMEEALSHVNRDSASVHSGVLANMAISHAQEGNADLARDYLDQARRVIHPGQNQFGWCLDSSAIGAYEGRVYLHLLEHAPNKNYAQMAYDGFSQRIMREMRDHYLSQTLIHKASAALALGDLHEYVESLENGARMALRIDSGELKQKAQTAHSKAPQAWLAERRYQQLAPLF